MIEFSGENEIELTPEELWPYFTDPDILAEHAPGCKEMNLHSPHEVTAVIAVGVGSVKPEFEVDVTITETDYPDHLAMRAEGHAPRNEFEATAEMDLVENDDGGTTLSWRATAEVSGTIASLGARALKSVTNRLLKKFFNDVQAAAEEGVPAEAKLEGAPAQDLLSEE